MDTPLLPGESQESRELRDAVPSVFATTAGHWFHRMLEKNNRINWTMQSNVSTCYDSGTLLCKVSIISTVENLYLNGQSMPDRRTEKGPRQLNRVWPEGRTGRGAASTAPSEIYEVEETRLPLVGEDFTTFVPEHSGKRGEKRMGKK